MFKRALCAALIAVLVLAAAALCACSQTSGDFSLSASNLSMVVGDSVVISVIAENGAAAPKITWTSGNTGIATVEQGTVYAKSAGTTVITATAEDGRSKTCNVSVSGKEVTKITLDHQTASLDAGKTIQLTATVTPADATDVTLSWSSSDESVAVVNSEGYITGVKDGVANIKCTAQNNVEASCTVTVHGSTEETSSDSGSDNNNNNNNAPVVTPNPEPAGHYGHFAPAYVYNPSDFVFPDSSTRLLTDAEITATLSSIPGYPISDSFAQDAINEIYARNGYVFKNPTLKSYYESKPWYYADSSFSTDDFNSTERANIDLLLKYA